MSAADRYVAPSLLEVRALRKTFHVGGGLRGRRREVHAVQDVSFAVAPGGSLGIVGESGSGKTTVARTLLGLERPDGGEILLDGHALTPDAPRRERRRRARMVQMVFQDPYTSLDPHQTVAATLNELQRVHFDRSRAACRTRTAELLEEVGLSGREGAARPRALSGGQRQRVAIARAIATEPRLIVLDEAVSALDVSVQAQILNMLADLRSELELTYILISHDLAVVRQLCDDVVVMHRGRVVEDGPVDAVLAAPREPYTRRLLQAVPQVGVSVGQAARARSA